MSEKWSFVNDYYSRLDFSIEARTSSKEKLAKHER